MGKIQINKKLKHDALLDTAFELFTSKGINQTSIADIVEHAGVAKGTFYLYFKDKYDIRNRLIAHKASQIFRVADDALHQTSITDLEGKIIFIIDHIINQFNENKILMNFISKNLSWGIFKNGLLNASDTSDVNFSSIFTTVFEQSPVKYKNPEILIYMIVELTSSACYSSILYSEPVGIEDLKPYLFDSIKQILKSQEISS